MTHENYMEWGKLQPGTRPRPLGLRLEPNTTRQLNVTIVPSSPMDRNAVLPVGVALNEASPSGFLDLKQQRFSQLVALNDRSLQNGPQVVKTEPGSESEFRSLSQGQTVLLNPRPLQQVLPAPTIGNVDFTKLLEKLSQSKNNKATSCPEPHLSQQGKKKTFSEGPTLPSLHEDEDDWCGIEVCKDKGPKYTKQVFSPSLPADHYTLGKVRYTTKTALQAMVDDLAKLKLGTTGCIIDAETCDPECDMYDQDVHFISEQAFGKGSFGQVDLCYDSKTKKPFIRKQVKKESLRNSEVIVPVTLNHRNITRFYGIIQREHEGDQENPVIELLIEFGGSSLNRYLLLEKNMLTQEQIWDLARQGLEALAHMDNYSIVHLDIKPENLCILTKDDGMLVLKVTDFGSSRLPQEAPKFVGVTPEYMAPEMCKLFLQTLPNFGLNWGLTEADITGKVDVFAFGLAIMYMYKGYHILVKVINNGNTTYEGVDPNTRRILHYQLMMSLADDNNADFVSNLTPDECDIDMRFLLKKLTEHKYGNRLSAKEALNIIEGRASKNCVKAISECKARERAELFEIQKHVPLTALPEVHAYDNLEIPGIAEDCMESENGPVKNRTKDLLRMKIKPYDKLTSKKAMFNKWEESNATSAHSSVSEMRRLSHGIASKRLEQMKVPMTPITEFESLSLGQTAMEEESTARMVSRVQLVQPSLYVEQRNSKMIQPIQPESRTGAGPGDIISLSQKKTLPVAGEKIIQIPQALMEILLKKKMATKQVKEEAGVCPNIIDIRHRIQPVGKHSESEFHSIRRSDSPVNMEQEDTDFGNIPKFAAFM